MSDGQSVKGTWLDDVLVGTFEELPVDLGVDVGVGVPGEVMVFRSARAFGKTAARKEWADGFSVSVTASHDGPWGRALKAGARRRVADERRVVMLEVAEAHADEAGLPLLSRAVTRGLEGFATDVEMTYWWTDTLGRLAKRLGAETVYVRETFEGLLDDFVQERGWFALEYTDLARLYLSATLLEGRWPS